LPRRIDKTFGSFSGFKDKLTESATKVFGSGWAWLLMDGKELKIESAPNQDAPHQPRAKRRCFGCDVLGTRILPQVPETAVLNISQRGSTWFNWDFVAERYEKLKLDGGCNIPSMNQNISRRSASPKKSRVATAAGCRGGN